MAKPDSKWYRLDNAGILYSALQKEEYSAIYRFSALMERDVDPAALQRAIDRCMPRFPSFAVRIRKGAFWYYLEPNTAPGPFLKEDVSDPCQPVRFKEDNGWLVRFYYYRSRISIEVFHALSDGGGAIVFFRTLLAEYLRQTGVDVPPGNGVLDLSEPPRAEELEDAYARYAGHHALGLHRQPKAYQNTGTPEPFYTFHVTMGFVPLQALRAEAKKYGASITEYLSAVLIYVILEKQKREKPYRLRPVALAVPINLRGWFPTETLRNFITTVRPFIDPALGDYTFPEIVSQVRHYMNEAAHQPAGDAGGVYGECPLYKEFCAAARAGRAQKSRHGAQLPSARCAPLFLHLYQSRRFYRAAGDGTVYPRGGSYPRAGDGAALPLRVHQLR